MITSNDIESSRKNARQLVMRVAGAIVAIVAAFAQPRAGGAQWILQSGQMDQQIRRSIEMTYNMQYDDADRVLDSVVQSNPEHPAGYFYKAMVDFWRAVTNTDNTTYDDNYKAKLDIALQKADSLLVKNDRDITGIFYKGAALGMRARIFSIRPTWEKAVNLMLSDAKEGVKYLDMIEEIIPSNSDVLFGRGLYNYYVEAIKEDHPILRPIIGLFATGNKRVGLQMLERAAENASYAKTEARYELLKLYYSYEKNYARAYSIAQFLTNKYPNNVVFLHYLGYSQHYYGLTEAYDSTYHVILARAREKREGYTIRHAREAMFFLGKAALSLPNHSIDSALYYLYNSNLLTRKLSPDEMTWWHAQSELLMGEAYDLKGDRKRAVEMYNRVLDMPEFSGSHGDAEKYLKNPYKR